MQALQSGDSFRTLQAVMRVGVGKEWDSSEATLHHFLSNTSKYMHLTLVIGSFKCAFLLSNHLTEDILIPPMKY